MNQGEEKNIAELLARDPDYPKWLASKRITHPAWFTCCHEAGHVIGGLVLLNAPMVMAVIFNSREGVTRLPRSMGFRRATVIALGEAGERLARLFPQPEVYPNYYSSDSAYDEVITQATDAELLCNFRSESCAPSRKMIRKITAEFVRLHAKQIITVAEYLFRHGSGEFCYSKAAVKINGQ